MNLYVWPQQDPDDQYLLHKDYYTRLQKMETEAGENMHKTKKMKVNVTREHPLFTIKIRRLCLRDQEAEG
jgi:hypothetical protein